MVDQTIIQGYTQTALRDLERTIRDAVGQNNAAGSNVAAARTSNQEAIENQTTAFQDLTGATKKASSLLSKAFDGIRNLTGNRGIGLLMDEFKSAIGGGVEAVHGSVEGFTDAGNVSETFAKAMHGDMSAISEATKSVTTGLGEYADRTMKTFENLGISIAELNEFNKQSRIASLHLGGMSKWQDKLAEKQEHYFARIGDQTEAIQHQTEMMNLLTYSGGEAQDLYKDFGKRLDMTNDDLWKMGVTYKQSRAYLQDMVKEDEVRTRLMSAVDKKRRLEILAELQERYKNLVAMGMSTEQAEAASKALEKLSGKGPLDRIRESAKMQAGMAALGMKNAAEMARIFRKGDRATEQERETWAKGLDQMQTILKESRTAPMQQELFTSVISMKTGLDNIPNVFSTKLGKLNAVSEDQLKGIQVIGKNTENLTAVASAFEKLAAVMEKSWVVEVPAMTKDLLVFGAEVGGAYALLKGVPKAIEASNSIHNKLVTTIAGWLAKDDEHANDAQEKRKEALRATEAINLTMIQTNQAIDKLTEHMKNATAEQARKDQDSIKLLQQVVTSLQDQLDAQKKIAKNSAPKAPVKGQQ